jgi:hypothetical protein
MWEKSSKKLFYENYLFQDYRLKSGIAIWILGLMISGRTVQGDYPRIEGNFSLIVGVKTREAMVNTDGK